MGVLAAPAAAQDEARMRRLEAEVRALQRAVFPGGDGGRFFTPEVTTPGVQPQTTTPAMPSSSALTDVLARLDAIEAQLARLTARSEENDNGLTQLRQDFEDAKARLEAVVVPDPALAAAGTPPLPSLTPSPTPTPAAAAPRNVVPTPASTPAPAAAAPSPERVAAVRAIAKPSTGDAGEDEYTYGFRLWDAGFFPEARQQLALFLQQHPQHRMVSYGRNLLGRAYLDDGQPREAARHFFENYQADKQGARAPDSLLYLAESMIAINDTSRACIALAEFGETYPALAAGRLQELYARTRSKVRCTG